MYGNFKKDPTIKNRDLLIDAHSKLEQYDKNATNSLSLLNSSPNKVLKSDIEKQAKKQAKQEEQYSDWFNQALFKEQEKKDSYVQNVSRNLGNKSYDANLAAQQNKLNSYYTGTQEYKNASKSFKEYEKNVQDLLAFLYS